MIGRLLLTFCLVAGWVSVGWSDIQAPEKVEVGKLLPVVATDDADIFIWSVPDGIDFVAIDGNKKLICTGLEGSYKFQLTTIKINWDTKQLTQSPQQTKVITIGKGLPPVPPPDDPVDPVDPALTGFAKEVYGWAKTVTGHRSLGVRLSDNYLTVSVKYGASELTLEQAMEELRTLNGKVLDSREKKDSWAIFGSRLEEKMLAGWPMTKEQFVNLLNDVALGLSHVR